MPTVETLYCENECCDVADCPATVLVAAAYDDDPSYGTYPVALCAECAR